MGKIKRELVVPSFLNILGMGAKFAKSPAVRYYCHKAIQKLPDACSDLEYNSYGWRYSSSNSSKEESSQAKFERKFREYLNNEWDFTKGRLVSPRPRRERIIERWGSDKEFDFGMDCHLYVVSAIRTIYDHSDYETQWNGDKIYKTVGTLVYPRINLKIPKGCFWSREYGTSYYGHGEVAMSWSELKKYVNGIRVEDVDVSHLNIRLPDDVVKKYNKFQETSYYGWPTNGRLKSIKMFAFSQDIKTEHHITDIYTSPIMSWSFDRK